MICVDASYVLKLFFVEEHSEKVAAMWSQWESGGVSIYAPYLLQYEFYNVIWIKTRKGLLKPAEQKKILDIYHQLNIEFVVDTDLLRQALNLANRFGITAIYDCVYLALAEQMNLDFFTADQKLFAAVGKKLEYVKCL